jgi:hypothetical protein
LSGNSATNDGGGIFNAGSLSVINNSIICGNSAAAGADLFNVGTFTVDNTSTICVIGP